MSAAAFISGICWTIVYIALVYRGFKDHSYGMPLAALALNFAWEFTYSFLYPPTDISQALVIINTIWCLFDSAIVFTLLKYGYPYFEEEYKIGKGVFYSFFLIALALSFCVMIFGATFFAPFTYFKGDTFESAKFIAMIQNAVMSILFVNMFYIRRKNGRPIEGQSMYAAICKMIGTSLTVGITSITSHPGNWHFIAIAEATCFIFDVWYVVVLWRELKAQGIHPLKRL